ncbi:ankyrin-2 isoform X5 [Anopheles arabiensis]|uniref:ankyrin-2 isoform X5 n=1 Tax=Anopheles arabiensis TaxID=7173 RepID=UPI001AAC89E4|nr:ankyrin-2 isoform X5 [Anopheles arabiensis]XP_040175559.1 ankyrin-2 isoform X5 [Anopheles arabiensis]XP_040175560.1 ankyrin-2 isoform X5 [Anopheles arabiensis]XP_040175561.1 ankyrin-2 isoform X5 [Anopheles arabiensis]XP_040175562.1 ankyrin-2 isoform X5 [Anopheles arabiensis]XP_040175563.1 ankyrin-2 isoform X5 [Anopheles arabiensis]XP_040175564.1 ankyrin-2 isoform X5 [Anopheles arabiensis]XP_040175565.1 ankyrin-2 isoform X5 [Anopheles arabiensis]XP_040175566.1 ankyrin-2 isoform X5 [Anophe
MLTLKKRFPSLQSLGSDGNTSFLRAARAGNLEKVLEHLKNNIDINTCNANGLNALHLASKDGHVAVVTELLARGATVDAATKKGNTALHIASLAGQEDVVKLLIKHNASVNVQSQNGFTPLYMAAQENHDSVVRLLLSNGANQSLATEDGFTPLAVAMQQGHDKVVAVLLESDTRGKVRLPALHIAAKKDDVKAATLLLENDHNPDVTSKSGFTPLHIASHYGNEAMANLLIQKGADVNYAAKHNISPLHVAAKWGKTNMVALLLEKGASIESKTRDGLTPLHCAARSGHEQVVDMLLERGAPISSKTKNGLAPLHMAAQGEHVDAARILLYHRAPVDEVTVDYLTALHVAAHCGHVRVAKLLLDRNADANARALNGFTPLHIACKKNRIKVVELLLKHGASISATTESGLTPLHVASFMGCMNIVIYLLQHDASPDVPTVRGETPLHLAARANQTDIIRILLRNGAQVDARAREQQTPLHIASRLGNVDIVMLLLQHGAQVDAVTKDMYTALHIAAKEGQDEVAAVLLNNGAQIDATTKKGFTPLHLTAKYGHMKVAELLLEKSAPVDAQGKNGVTPLHVASHYDHQNVAMLLLEKGASPHATAKNGHTPLHIAARKNQIDIANTLLKYEAQANAESKAGFTPLHLSAQEGHTEMSGLLLESKANPDHQARNGLTPMHLCAQEDRVSVAQVLVKHGANLQAATKAGYTPLHVASHFGQANMVRYLIEQQVDVNASTGIGYTPLHQASQQGHCHIVNILLESNADPNAITNNGQTSLKIAQKLGYISVLDSLKSVTDAKATPDQPPSEEKYRVVAPEAMHETFMSDSEEEGGEDTVLSDQPYRYLTVDEMKSLGDDSLPIDVTRDERMDSNKMVQSTDSHQFPPTALEDSISPQHASMVQSGISATDFTDNINIERHSHVGKLHWKNFLVSFLVDARGGAMRGCRHSGVRIIVPARSAAQPTRITCRYVKPQRTMHPPPLMEGEALASRVLELGPVGAKFLGPVIMEVPHFASLRGKEREIVILRSDNGETWREHNIDMSDEIIHDVLNECFEPEELAQLDELGGGRICRFVTYDFPQYFAVISRIRQEVHAIGPEGGMVSSTVVPQVQAVFPQGALTKKIKVGLQAQPIDPDLTAKLLGRGVAVSPVVTVEPRRRKFHKAITLSMPAPRAHSQGMINQYSGSAPTLRLLCSITGVFRKRSLKGGTTRAQWEDVTGSTPLTFVNDCVSFTTTVSARFWLMDCRNIADATKMATELYKEAIHVPFMAKFVVFAKRTDPLEARLRVFCMTDDREDKTLEHQEHFTEVAKSRDVEVLEDKPQYIELAGNLVPVTKSGEQLALPFKAFRENRLPFAVRVKDQHADIVGRTLFMREPKIAKGEPPQQPICILNIVLPETIIPEQTTTITDSHEIMLRVGRVRAVVPPRQLVDDQNYLGELRIVDISNLLGEDWIRLAPEIGVSETDVENIVAQIPASTAQQAQAMLKQFQSKPNNDFNILENGLRTIHRDDIVERCIRSATTTGTTTTVTMRNKTSFSIGKRSVEAVELLSETDSIAKMAQKEDRLSKQESTKYSAEEKTVEESEESEEEMVKKTVAERRKQIEKRLSADRSIPASTQKREIVEEIITIKRQSVIDDTRAKHEEEILLQKPIDNTYKSSTMPEPVVKLKTTVVKDGPGVRKDEFEQELQDKFKVTLKNVEEFEHRSEVLEQLATEATSVSASSPRVVEEIKKKVEERVPAALDEPTEPAEQQPVESAVPPVPKERAPVPAKRTSLTKEPEEFQGVVEESIKDVKQRISSFETKSKTESLVDSKQSSVDTTSGRDSWSDDHRQASKRTDSEQISEDSEQEPLLRRDEHFSVQRTVGESSVVTTTQQAFTTVEQLERHDVSHAVEEKRESLLEAFGATDAGPAQWKEPDSEPSSLSEATGSSTSRREESISQHFKSETVSKVEETVTKMSTTVETKTVAGLPEGLDAFTLGKGDETIVREEFVARSAESSSIVDRTVESVVREVRDQEPAVEKRDMHREVKETADKMAALSSVETVQIGEGTAPQVSTAAAYTVERFEGLQSEVVSQDAAGMVAERTGTAVSSVETGVSQGEDTVSEKIVEREEEVRRRVEENVSIDKPVVQETVARTVTQEVTSKIPVPSKKSSPEAKDQPPMPAAQPTDGEPSAVDRMEAADQPKQTIEQQQAELSSRAEEMIETVVEHAESVASRIPRFGTTKPAAPQPEAVVAAKSPGPDTSSLSKIPVLKDRKVSEQFSSDSCETVIVQRSVEELQPHAEQVTASETVPDREYDEEIMSATAYGSERTVTEIITEDHRAVTPDDFIDEIIDEAQDKVQRQLQSAEVTVGTLDLSHSEEESFDKSAYPMQEYISRPGGGSGFDANATIEDDDEDEEAEREREKWKDTYTEHDDALPTSTRSEGEDDGYLVLVRSEAGRLVDDVLEQSVSIVSSSQGPGPMTIDRDLQQPSESEQYAIRSDILSSTDGDLVVKSPTIESMSGKSFDDNMSNPEYDALLLGTAGGQPMSRALGADDNAAEDEGSDAKLTADGTGALATATKDQAAESARRAKKIDRKYARLSADLGPEALLDKNQEYDEAISQIKDEVSMLQSEYSKMSWDESVSMTTGDFGSSTPDNDLQETDLQLQTENNIPQTTTPRLVSQTLEAAAPPASAVSDAFVSGQCVAIAATSASIVTTTAANLLTDANDVATADQCFAASATSVERTEQSVLSTTTSTIGSISNAEQSFSIASTEPDRPSESSSSGGGGGFDGQPVPKPRTSISSRTDTATRSSLLESFEHQDSIEQYPEPAPVQSAEQDLRLRQGSITSDELSNVAQKDSSELVTSEEDISSGAKFFIGECSSDIITRSSTEKRSDFAFDNEGYTFSQESQGTDDQESRRDAMEAYQQQIKLEDGFTLDSLKELDIAGLQSSGKPPVVHSPVTAPATVQPFAETQSVKSQVHVGEATILESTTTEQQEQQQQQYAHMTIDELTIAKTLEEVKESLDAVQEELIEAVTDGTPIKQSPSEFEFKILPSTRYVQDPIYETNQEEAVAVSTATGAAITTTTIVSESGLSDSETRSVAAAATAPPIKIDEAPTAAGSSDSSQLEASPRLRHGPAAAKGNRWSATDVDSSGESHYQSFEHTDSSRPLSSDLEQVLPYASSEYETALDHSMVPTSLGTEYHSAVSTLHSYAVSSHDSMKSFDSESSGNLASIESEATETLVPSTMDVDFDSSDAALIHDDSEDDLRDKLLLLDDKEEPSSAASSSVPIAMKRSHEMDFAELKGETVADESLLQFGEQRSHGVESVSSSFQEEKLLSSSIGTARDLVEAMQATSLEDVKTEPADDGKLGTSLEDGSILSISLSSASNLETIMENLSDKTTSIGPVPTHVEIGLDAVTPTTAGTTAGYIGDITLTSTTLKEGDVNFLNTQATTEMIEVSESAELIAGREDSEETVRKRGHKRTESTAIISGKFMAEMGENRDSIESQDESLSQDAPKPPATSSERDETRDESSDSDYDRYESEYARSFRAPVAQPKKKDKKAGDVFEKDFELDRRNSFSPSQSVIETIVEDVHAEIEQGDEAQQIMVSKSQRLQEYRESSTHNIPDIHVTEDFAEQQQQQSSDGEEEAKREATVFSETVSVVETVTKTQADATVSSSATTVRKVATETASTSAGMTMAKQTGIQYAKQEEFQLTEEQYQELIEQKYKAKLADSTTKYAFDADDKDDSAGSDSFEMLEQPDISDEFVIVEEVAREAHEFDAEGKSVAIKPTKIEKKHDEDVEKILVKSAPAHTNAGSLYAANMRDDMMYEFEESPPTGGAEGVDGGAGVTMDLLNNGYPLEESKRWVEMQLAETQNFRYPYEDRLEDIKEEDTDFEVGSSRIGSIKDSFSSTPDYDLLAKRMASREHDDISMSSLQEFENLEHVISLENRKMQQGSQDSLSNGSFTRRFMQRGMHGDDISLSSLKEFEGLENACLEAHLIEIKAKEEAALLLSRSDESNKSNGSNGAKRSPPSNGAAAVGSRQQSTEGAAATKIISSSTSITTTVVGGAVGSSVPSGEMTKVERKITTSSGSSREGSSTTTVTTITHVEGQTRQGLDEEDSTSHHILTVSSDSLDGTRVKQPLASGRDALPSAHSSSDSLDMHSKNNVDPMTSSIDSIEFSKTGIATTRSSQSDSIEQMAQQQQQPNRSDSTDSIEAQQQLQQQQKLQHHQTYHQTTTQQTLSDTKRDSLESLAASSSDNQSGFSSPTKSAHGSRPLSDSGVGASGTTAHQQQQQFHHQTTTMSTHTVSTGGRTMQKDISADSLTGPDAAFLTSTESLETSSTATNATYQNETDSQMSSSVTSCDSITMVDTVGPSQSLEHWDSSFTAGVHGGGFGASSLMTSSSMSAYSSGVVGSSGGTTIQQQQQQQQHAFRTSHAEASSSIRMSSSSTSSSSTVTMVASSASSTSVRTAQQQLMGESELLSRELFPGEIAFDDVKETSKERMQSKSTEKEE